MKNLTVNRLLSILLIIVAVLLTSITFIFSFLSKNDSNKSDTIVNNYNASDNISQAESNMPNEKFTIYTVKESDGLIAVFENGKKVDIMLDKVFVNTLPQKDQDIIVNGIEFNNYNDLISFLENYE